MFADKYIRRSIVPGFTLIEVLLVMALLAVKQDKRAFYGFAIKSRYFQFQNSL